MAEVIFLKPGEALPEDVPDHIEILFNAETRYYDTVRLKQTPREIAYDHGRAPFEQALELAQQDAEAFGIEKIYVLGIHHA